MFYRLKNKKGFTLIELIVVIAILGILALIAIPRFAGFTQRARVAADEQYGRLVGNSAMVLLAAGDISIGTGNAYIEVTKTNGAVSAISNITVAATGLDAALDTPVKQVNYLINQLTANKEMQHYPTLRIVFNEETVVSVGTPTSP